MMHDARVDIWFLFIIIIINDNSEQKENNKQTKLNTSREKERDAYDDHHIWKGNLHNGITHLISSYHA